MTPIAWTMEKPPLYGELHIFLAALYICFAVFLARIALRLSYDDRIKILSVCGWLLLASEVFKQIYIYKIVNGGFYDYWFIPFQLCSMPMYLCILLPVLKGKYREAVLTFLLGYTFISAVATFIYPEDILRPQILLTLHGFDWHAVLLFISLTIGFSGMADLSLRGFKRATCLFLLLSALAIAINIATEKVPPLCSCGRGYSNMFYLSPYHSSNQPIVGAVEASLGRTPAMLLYTISLIAAAGFINFLFYCITTRSRKSESDSD